MDDIWSGEPNIVLDGKYRIEALLGQGGMGAVYRATHLGTTRTVAVKIIHPRFSQDPEFVERFRREAEASGRLRHPNVVDVTDFGFAPTRTGQVAYLVMETSTAARSPYRMLAGATPAFTRRRAATDPAAQRCPCLPTSATGDFGCLAG